MGGQVKFTFYSTSEDAARTTALAAFAEFARLEDVYSDYRPQSELMRLSAKAGQGPVPISSDLLEILRHSRRISVLTDGAFEVTASPIIRLWRKAREDGKMPPAEALAEARSRVGFRRLSIDPIASTIALEPGTSLDLGGIAKGWACEAAVNVFRSHGINSVLVEAGGDIAAGDAPPEREGWAIAIRGREDDPILLANQSMSTSGDAYQFVEIEGNRYSHIVDPRTGLGVTNRVQATVISRNGADADALATALCVLAPTNVSEYERRFKCRIILIRSRD